MEDIYVYVMMYTHMLVHKNMCVSTRGEERGLVTPSFLQISFLHSQLHRSVTFFRFPLSKLFTFFASPSPPPPLVVFDGELEVCQRDGDERGDDDEDDEDNEEDGVDGVDLVPPNRRENVIQLDVDGTEGEETRHAHLGWGVGGVVGGIWMWGSE